MRRIGYISILTAGLLALCQSSASAQVEHAQAESTPDPWKGSHCQFELSKRNWVTLGPGTRINDVRQVVRLDKDRFMVSSASGGGIDVFDGQGGFLWSVGRSIMGPFRIVEAGPMLLSGYRVHAMDTAAQLIYELDYDGDLIRETKVGSRKWSAFLPVSGGVMGYRSRPSTSGMFETAPGEVLFDVPIEYSDIHSLAILLDDPRLSLLAGSANRFFFALPGHPALFVASERKIEDKILIPDEAFRLPIEPYRSFFSVELDRVTGRLDEYLENLSRIVGVYELDEVVAVVISHDGFRGDQALSLALFSKELRFLDLIRFGGLMKSREDRVPVGFTRNSIVFARGAARRTNNSTSWRTTGSLTQTGTGERERVFSSVKASGSSSQGKAAGTRLLEFTLHRLDSASDASECVPDSLFAPQGSKPAEDRDLKNPSRYKDETQHEYNLDPPDLN